MLSAVSVGTGLLTVKVRELLVPPSVPPMTAGGLMTFTGKNPAEVSRLAGTITSSSVEETKDTALVGRLVPFQWTWESVIKLLPIRMTFVAALPARAWSGISLSRTGIGL